MSDHIPFDIQSQIIQRLPVKSLVQFRSVSKQWKSFIDDPEFIKTYHINHPNPQHHLLVRYTLGTVETYISIVDDNTFPQQKFPLTAPKSLSLLRRYTEKLSYVDGLLCFYGCLVDSSTQMAVIWNPSIRKSVDIVIPRPKARYLVVGFGICRDTSDPKIVTISFDATGDMWEVEVFTLSTRAWKPVYTGAPFKAYDLSGDQVFVDGVIYFGASRCNHKFQLNIIISFDLKSEKFGEVCLPDSILHLDSVDVVVDIANVNNSLGLLEYRDEGCEWVCGVWMRKDGANKPFTKIYTVKVDGKTLYRNVLGFRNNGEVVIELDDDDGDESSIEVYEPSSGHINGVVISGTKAGFGYAGSYMEMLTLLLLDESHSIIH